MNIDKSNVFTADNLRADHYMQDGACETLVITFTERGNRDLEGQGFGTPFLIKNGFDVLAIKTNLDVWYENFTQDQTSSILAYLNSHPRRYKHVVGYGSSMGAYAAMRFSGDLLMTHAIAISPLYDIKSDFDKRWAKDKAQMNGDPMMENRFISPDARYLIVCDNKSPDFAHLRQFESVVPAENLSTLKLPYSGHPSGYMLNDIGLLQEVVLTYLRTFNVRIDPKSYKAKKLKSPPYLFNLVNALLQHRKYRAAISLNKLLIDLKGDNAEYHFQTCRIFEKMNQLEDAIAAASRAAAISPNNPSFALYRDNIIKRQQQSALHR